MKQNLMKYILLFIKIRLKKLSVTIMMFFALSLSSSCIRNIAFCKSHSSPYIQCERLWKYSSYSGLKLQSANTSTKRTVSSASSVSVCSDDPKRIEHSTINFDDFSSAFQSRTISDILVALGILQACSSDILVRNSEKLLHGSRKLLGRRLFHAVVKPTLYRQFVGGDTEETITRTVQKLQADGIGPMLMLPMEEDAHEKDASGSRYDRNLDIMLNSIYLAKQFGDSQPMLQIKLTALLPGTLCLVLSECCHFPSDEPACIETIAGALQTGNDLMEFKNLSCNELRELNKALARIRTLCNLAAKKEVMLLVDAEYTYINPALNLLSLAMMCYICEHHPRVLYTYQNYLKATHDILCKDIAFTKAAGICFGTKLVRGAYMDKERRLAKEQGYSDPVCDTFSDTTDMYYRSMDTMLSQIAAGSGRMAAVIATHNEDTVHKAISRMQSYGITPQNEYVFFGQVYGMGDFISGILGQNKYRVYKSIPYGIPEDTLPYLSRRVTENRAVLDGARREKSLLQSALKERLFGKARKT